MSMLIAATNATAQQGRDDDVWLVSFDRVDGEYTSAFFVDASRIEIAPRSRRAWIRVIHSPDNQLSTLAGMATLTEYDCDGHRSHILQSTAYERDGSARRMTLADEWTYVVPDSFGERILEFVCATPAARLANEQWIRLDGVTPEQMADSMFHRSGRSNTNKSAPSS